MAGTAILSQVIEILVGGITGIAEGIGAGLSTLATSIFLSGEGDTQTLSTFGVLVVVFAGISLAIGKIFAPLYSNILSVVRKKLEGCKMLIRTEVIA